MTTSIDRPRRRAPRASLLWAAGLAVLAGVLLVLVLLPIGRTSSAGHGSLVGSAAPSLEAADLDGRRRTLADGGDRLIWVNFWATWCPPCRTEMPMMQRLAEAYGDRLLILGVDFGEEPSAARNFVERYDIKYPILLDPTLENFYRWSPQFGLPRHYFVRPGGTVVHEVPGELPPSDMAKVLEQLLGPVEP
ncbi:MAG: TlpA family protein disulfide reductase [Chloroflexota bacterium]|nr:TlpA family protein disulfide reductase [Chloroflexota bacterium]